MKVEMELSNAEVATVVATLGVCCMKGLVLHLPQHSALGRRVQKVESSISDLAAITGVTLNPAILDAAPHALVAAMQTLAEELQYGTEKNNSSA